jgi:SAM-dependent methyltransferase
MTSAEARWLGSMPDAYDRCLGPVVFAPWAGLLAGEVARRRPRRVLEIAAGTGILTRALVAALPDAEVVATDLNPAMVAWGEAHVPGASWQVADAQQLDPTLHDFDVVACQFGVMFFPDRQSAFGQVRAALRPVGSLVFSTWDRIEFSTFAAALAGAVGRVLETDAPTFLTRVPHGYTDVGQIEADVRAAGLASVHVQREVPTAPAASVAEVAHGFCFGTPLRFELERRGEVEELAAAIAADMTARLGDGPALGELAGYLVTAEI